MPPINKGEGTTWSCGLWEEMEVFCEDVFEINICVCFVNALKSELPSLL